MSPLRNELQVQELRTTVPVRSKQKARTSSGPRQGLSAQRSRAPRGGGSRRIYSQCPPPLRPEQLRGKTLEETNERQKQALQYVWRSRDGRTQNDVILTGGSAQARSADLTSSRVGNPNLRVLTVVSERRNITSDAILCDGHCSHPGESASSPPPGSLRRVTCRVVCFPRPVKGSEPCRIVKEGGGTTADI